MYLFLFIIGILLILIYKNINGLLLLYTINYNKEKSHYKAIEKTIKIICWFGYIYLYQKIYHNCINIEKNKYDIHYIYHGQLYKIRCINKLGPKKNQVLMVANDKLEDISDEIIPFMGPKQNFHKLCYTPNDFKQRELSFYLSDGRILTFDEKMDIKLD